MEKLDTLDLLEIKQLCKKYGIGTVGDKKSLIKKLSEWIIDILDKTKFTIKYDKGYNGAVFKT